MKNQFEELAGEMKAFRLSISAGPFLIGAFTALLAWRDQDAHTAAWAITLLGISAGASAAFHLYDFFATHRKSHGSNPRP